MRVQDNTEDKKIMDNTKGSRIQNKYCATHPSN